MRIVILVSSFLPEVNGAAINLQRRLEFLSAAGHDVLILVPDYSASKKYSQGEAARHQGHILPRVEAVPYPSEQMFMSMVMLPLPGAVSTMAPRIEQFRPDVIQVEGAERFVMGARELPAVKIAARLRVPVVALHHTNYVLVAQHYAREPGFGAALRVLPLVSVMRQMLRWLYNSFDLTMAPSPTAAGLLRGYGVETVEHVRRSDLQSASDPEQVAFIGIDMSLFNTSLVPAQDPLLDRLGTRVRVLHVGRLDWVKRLDVVLEALDLVEARRPGLVGGVLAGGATGAAVAAAITSEVRRREAEGRLAWLGVIPNDSLGAYYRCCDVAVIASADETAPLVVMEAMACGLPVVGPAAGGAGQLITDENTGLTFQANSAAQLADRIISLAADPDRRRSLAKNAAEEARQRFCVEAAAQRVTDRLEALVRDREKVEALRHGPPWLDWRGLCFCTFWTMAYMIGTLAVYIMRLVRPKEA